MTPPYYHYTNAVHLDEIMSSRVIEPTESNLDPVRDHAGPDVVWLLDHSADLSHDHGLGGPTDKKAGRIAVDVPAICWLDWEPASRMEARWKRALVDAGGGPEAAAHWYVWPAPIRAARWREVALRGSTGWAQPADLT